MVQVNNGANGTNKTLFNGTCSYASCTALAAFAAPSKTYYVFSLRAQNQLGYGGPSATAQNQSIQTPSPPLNVTARVNSPLTIVIQWNAPADTGVGDASRPLLSFMVQRCFGLADSSCSTPCSCTQALYSCSEVVGETCSHTGISPTTFTDSFHALAAGPTRYYFRVSAQNDAGFGLPSATVNEQSITVPASPASLSFSNPAPLTVNLSWSLPVNTGTGATCTSDCRPLTGIQVTCTTPTRSSCANQVLQPTAIFDTIGALSKLVLYNFSFIAINDAGPSLASVLASVKSVDLPSAPSLFSAAPLINTPRVIVLSWGLPADTCRGNQLEQILLFQLEFDATSSSFNADDTKIVACGTIASCTAPYSCWCGSFNATVTMPASRYTPYYFRLFAKNIVGAGAYAYASSQSVERPSAPLNLSTQVIGIESILLVWFPPSNLGVGLGQPHQLLYYAVQRSFSDSTFSGCAYGTPSMDACALSVSGACCTQLLSGTTSSFLSVVPSIGPSYFYFRVIAQNEAGLGNSSLAAKEQGVGVPSAPNNVAVSVVGPARFRVQWGNVSDTGVGGSLRPLLYFRVEICQSPIYDFSVLYLAVDLSSSTFSFSTAQVLGGRNYSFRVVAYNDAGRGIASSAIVELAVALPTNPRQFTAIVQQPLQINLAWVIPADTGADGVSLRCF